MQTVGNNEDRTCTVDCGEEKNVELSLLQNAENDTAEQRHQSIIRIPCGIFFAMTSTLRVCFPLEREAQASSEHKLFDTSLFRNMPFLFYAISFSLLTMAMKSATIFFPALSMSRGLSSSQAAYLLSISGVVETISRLLSGFILEMPCIRSRRPVVYNGILVVIALVLPVMPLLQDFSHFAIIHSVYALLTGMILSQKCVILLDILGNEKMSSSFGLLIAFQGFGVVTGPPLSGLLKDIFQRYDEVFYLCSILLAVASIFQIISNLLRCRNKMVTSTMLPVIIHQTAEHVCKSLTSL